MKRVVPALAAAVVAAVLVPASASAAEIQVGVSTTPLVSPTCPANAQGNACTIILAQVTAYETLRDGIANPVRIKKSGVISSFTLGLTGTNLITPAVIAAKDQQYGGPPEAQLTALRPTGTPANPSYRVAAQSAVVKLRPQLGKVAEFPLVTPLPVVRGEILALTIPTWAPVLSIEQKTTKFAYAQSRSKSMVSIKTKTGSQRVSSCNTNATANLAQIVVGQLSTYGCNYAGTRMEYSALEITTPAGFTSNTRRHLTAARRAALRRWR
ncbi:MAG: hypothetical protein KGL16_01755 [Acidobacteriota bacterium]|nr:hypothetical protein [Acidobacteriota bacterium]